MLKLIKEIENNPDSPAFEGVPFPTGVEFEVESREDKTAAKLLNFIDGTKSIRELCDMLPLDPSQIAGIIGKLYDYGAIAFDQEFCDTYMIETPQEEKTEGKKDRAEKTVETPPEPSEQAKKLEEEAQKGQVKIEILEEGSLEEIPLWQRFNQLERKSLTGRVQVITKSARREFFFLNGALSFATSDNEEEDIGYLLLKKKKISRSQYETYKSRKGQEAMDPYKLLVDIGSFPEHQKLMAKRWASQNITFNALAEKNGTFIIEKWDRLPPQIPRLGLNFKGIMAKFMGEVLPIDEEAEKLREKMHWWIVPLSEELDREVNEKEKRLWEIIYEKPRMMRDIMSLTTMYRKETYKFILTLLTAGLIELVKHPPVEEGPIDLKKLDQYIEELLESNYFDVLTVHPVSDDEDIEKAYNKLIKKFDPSLYPSLTEHQREKLDEGRQIAQQAWQTLKNENSRRIYRKKVFSEYQLRQYAQLQFQKGEIYLWWRHDPGKAHYYFKSSMDLDPENDLYKSADAFCVLSMPAPPPGLSVSAVRTLEKLAAKEGNDPTVDVFTAGGLLKTGKKEAAEKLFARALHTSGNSAGIKSMINIIMTRDKEKQL